MSRRLENVIDAMLAVIPSREEDVSYQYTEIRFSLEEAKTFLPYCPPEAYSYFWDRIASKMWELWVRDWRYESYEDRPSVDEVEQKLVDIFRGGRVNASIKEITNTSPRIIEEGSLI